MNQRLHLIKKPIFATLVLLLITFAPQYALAQLVYPDAVAYRTGFFDNYYTNPDSALIYARKLSSHPKYAFPVAMNDQRLDRAYNVHGFPTKALITLEGNYLQIPFISTDWIKFIERYVED